MTNSKTTKRALVSSALAMFMCVAMLIGTTFAWFTDTASTSVNKIQAGTLDVALEVADGTNADGTTKWVSAEGKTLDFVKAKGHEKEAILWEPGCTYSLPELRIVNKGNLALKYKVVITGIKGDAKLNEVIVWTIKDKDDDYAVATEHSLDVNESRTFTISGTMKTSAGNAYQGLSIDGISITVAATQDTVEHDSNNNQYDKDATLPDFWNGKTTTPVAESEDGKYHITSASELVWLMDNTQDANSAYLGETIVLDKDINLGGYTVKGIGSEQCNFAGNFDGQGFTISNFVIERSNQDDYAGLFNYYTNGTLENLTVDKATINGISKVGALIGGVYGGATVKNCFVVGCSVTANRKVGGAIGYAEASTIEKVSVKNTNIYVESTDDTQYGKVVGYKNTGAVVTGVSDENVTIHTGYAFVSSVENLNSAIANGCSNVTLNTSINNDTPPHTGGDSAYHPYQVADQYTINNGQELTIDLNGEVFDASVRLFHVLNGGKLTIKSSKSGGKITINTTDPDFNYAKNAFGMQVKKGGVLNIEENVTIEMNVVGVANPVALCCNNGTVNINGGEIIVYDSVVFTNDISNFGTVNMNGGKITLESKQTNGTSIGFAITGNKVDVNLNAGSIEGKGLGYKVYYGNPEIEIAEGFVINTTQGPNH